MRFQLWAMDLYHRAGDLMITPDYMSRVGADLCFDELTRNYLNRTVNLRKNYPPATGTMLPENMPGYRAPRVRSILPTEAHLATTLFSSVTDVPYVDPAIAPILSSITLEILEAICSASKLCQSSLVI